MPDDTGPCCQHCGDTGGVQYDPVLRLFLCCACWRVSFLPLYTVPDGREPIKKET